MKPVQVPDRFLRMRPWARLTDFTAPTGVSHEECGTAPALIDDDAEGLGALGHAIRLYLEIEPDELKIIESGNAVVELTVWGDHLHPFAVQVYERTDD